MTKTPDPVDDEAAVPVAAKRARWSVGRIMSAAAGVGAIAIGVAAVLFPRDGVKPRKKD